MRVGSGHSSLSLDFLDVVHGVTVHINVLFLGDFEPKKVHENMVRADSLLHFLLASIFLWGGCGCLLTGEEGPEPVHGAHAKGGQHDEHK